MFLCSCTIFLLHTSSSRFMTVLQHRVFMLKMFFCCQKSTNLLGLFVFFYHLVACNGLYWSLDIYMMRLFNYKPTNEACVAKKQRGFRRVSGLINVTQLLRLNASSPLPGESHPRGGRQQLISLKHTLLIKQTSIIKEGEKGKGDAPAIPA